MPEMSEQARMQRRRLINLLAAPQFVAALEEYRITTLVAGAADVEWLHEIARMFDRAAMLAESTIPEGPPVALVDAIRTASQEVPRPPDDEKGGALAELMFFVVAAYVLHVLDNGGPD